MQLSLEWTVVEWAGGCTSCGSPVPCPKWIVTGTLSCELYPCLCDQTKAEAYELHGIDDPSCWWKDRKRGGRLASRCPCWGRVRDDRLPRGCCSRHEGNPQYLVVHPEMEAPAASGFPTGPDAGEAPERTTSTRSAGTETAGAMASYRRLWPPSEVTCDCVTPWDNQKTVGGYHCCDCHTNWTNVATAMLHRPTILHRCRDPQSIVDVDTGRPLLYPRDVRGVIVWTFAW